MTTRGLLIIAFGCTHTAPPTFPADNRWSAVPLHVWHARDLGNDGSMCEPYFIEPATLCVRSGQSFDYDGCHWRCLSIDVGKESQ